MVTLTASTKVLAAGEALASITDGMTVGVGGWVQRRKPLTLVRHLVRGPAAELTVVTMGGDDADVLCESGKVRKLVCGVAPGPMARQYAVRRLERLSRFVDEIEIVEEWVLRWALYGGSLGVARMRPLPDPVCDGLARTVPALRLDAALIRMDRSDARGNVQLLTGDLYLDDLLLAACSVGRRIVECDRLIQTEQLLEAGGQPTMRISRDLVDTVVEAAPTATRPAPHWAPPALAAVPSRTLWRGDL